MSTLNNVTCIRLLNVIILNNHIEIIDLKTGFLRKIYTPKIYTRKISVIRHNFLGIIIMTMSLFIT